MKFTKFSSAVLVIAIVLGLFLYYRWRPLTTRITFANGQTVYADVAVTNTQREQGLGGRPSLPADHGMLFVFSDTGRHAFWMKGMEFPLDFVWMYGNQVTEVTRDVPLMTDGQISTIIPTKPVDKVLEVNAGTVERLGIHAGDTFVIRN